MRVSAYDFEEAEKQIISKFNTFRPVKNIYKNGRNFNKFDY